MSAVLETTHDLQAGEPQARQALTMSGVTWADYSRLLRIFEDRPGYRLTFDRGVLEIMSPTLRHDRRGRFLGAMIRVLTEESSLPIVSGGSVTIRRRKKMRGIEADDCFWIQNAGRMAGREELDLRVDPAPDLAVEVDVTSSSLDRMSIHAALSIPELWRLDPTGLSFHVLAESGTYETSESSRCFPWLRAVDLQPFVHRARATGDENTLLREFREWVREQIARQAALPGEAKS